jgi:hypothetical protein
LRIRFFYLDESGTVHKAEQRKTEAAFLKGERWDQSSGTKSLRIVSFICDDKLRPLRVYITKVAVQDGFVSDESRREAIKAYLSKLPPLLSAAPTEFPLIDKQFEEWPDERKLFPQLTNALDIPIDQMPTLYFGGPLLMALHLGVSVKQALTYLDLRKSDRAADA